MRVDAVPQDDEEPDALFPADAPAHVWVTCSITRGKALDPGIHAAPFVWRDVVSRPPPRSRGAAGTHVTYHLTEQSPDVRVSFVTHVRVDPGHDLDSPLDDVIHVEERLYVQRRVLHELIDREREFSDRLAMRWRSQLNGHLVAQRLRANHVKQKWLLSIVLWLLRIEAKVGHAGIRGTRAFLRSLVHLPDVILTRSVSARRHMASRLGRRSILQHLKDPSLASNEEKGVLLLIVAAIIVSTVLIASNVIALGMPRLASYYSTLTVDATYNILNVFVPIPIPPEVWIIGSIVAVGPALGWTGLFVGKALGSWLLFLVGDSLHDTLDRQTRGKPRLQRVVRWVKVKADKSGFWILFVLNFVPFLPDTLMIAFAVSGMRFRPFIGGILIGTLLKYLMIVGAVVVVGTGTVEGWLDAVGAWLNPANWF